MNDAIPLPNSRRAWLIRLAGVLWLVVLAIALHALHKEWSGFHLTDLNAALVRIGPQHVALALAFTVLSYFFNASLGLLAQRWLGIPQHRSWRDLTVSFISSAFSLNAGGSVLGGGSVRIRFAESQGMTVADVGKMTAFCMVAAWLGHAFLCGVLLLISPPRLDWLPVDFAGWIGAALITSCLLLVLAGGWLKRFRGKWPSPVLACITLIVSTLDWFFAGLAMWALFPGVLPVAMLAFVAVVAIAQALSAAAHVPGGVGVLELSITKMLAGSIPAATLAGSLIIYRLLYYLLPFLIAMLMLGWRELWSRRTTVKAGAAMALRGWNTFAPRLGALLALGGGFLLLLSANTPMEPARREYLADWLPLPFVETSHFVSSISGALLIVLARGLQRRIQAAWWLTIALTFSGIVFSLAKGFDWEEALVLSFLLVCLLPFRQQFHRHAGIWTQRFTFEWWLLLLALVGVATWLGFFTSRHIGYTHDLWWQFSFDGDASRFLRALVGAAGVFLIVALAQWLRPVKPRHAPMAADIEEVQRIVALSSNTGSALAFLGDKEFEFSADRRCFLMYADKGRSRIVMGDPVGDRSSADDLLWKFIERAQDEGFRPVFYEISAAEMPRQVDMGFKLYKLGEEARVLLGTFSLEGPAARKLRQAKSRFMRGGYIFTIWDVATVRQNFEQLRAVSDAWVGGHHAKEKGFSLGGFQDDYMRRFPCAVVLAPSGTLVAFANIWATADKIELSIDLMRHVADTPGGVMDYLFTEIMTWGKAQGYRYFNLGMAPLSGFSTHPLAPLWSKIAARIFHRGGNFYNFRGLRDYKNKFGPSWEPRYIAVPSTWSLPTVLLDATSLIGGGLRGTLAKEKS